MAGFCRYGAAFAYIFIREKTMTQPYLQNSSINHISGYGEYSYSELVSEMKSLGMDPRPLLEIAANDILSQHGSRGQAYARRMLDQMIAEDDLDGIYLWNALLNHIYNHISHDHHIIH